MSAMDQVIQVLGAMMILVAYAAGQTGRWSTDNRTYLWLNLVGSADPGGARGHQPELGLPVARERVGDRDDAQPYNERSFAINRACD